MRIVLTTRYFAAPSSLVRGIICAAMAAGLLTSIPAQAQEEDDEEQEQEVSEAEKSSDDPTKIATKIGVSYSQELSVSGSFAFGEKFKVNGRISKSGQWSVGASYLLGVAIITFSAARSNFDSGVTQTRYSLGGFVPLGKLGLDTGKLQLFVPFGYTYTKGQQLVTDIDQSESFPVDLSSNSAYLGISAIRPLNEKFTLTAGANVTKGTNDFSGISVGGGVSYHLTHDDTIGLSGSYVDNSFGQNQRIRISYRHEF